jgi:hypothetical protein
MLYYIFIVLVHAARSSAHLLWARNLIFHNLGLKKLGILQELESIKALQPLELAK